MHTYKRYLKEPNPLLLMENGFDEWNPWRLTGLGYVENVGPDSDKQSISLDEVHRELEGLFRNYPSKPIFGARHRAQCSVWRSDYLVANDESLPRFANRVFVFEGIGVPPEVKEAALADSSEQKTATCDPIHFRKTRFLGYLSMRPRMPKLEQDPSNLIHPERAVTIVAFLQPPRYMSRPLYHVLTTVIGPPDGVMPFRATPFCRIATDFNRRAFCLFASLHAALLLKANGMGCCPVSSQDMVSILWKQYAKQNPYLKKGPHTAPDRVTMKQIVEKGFDFREAQAVLQQVNAMGKVETIWESDSHFQPLGEEVSPSRSELRARSSKIAHRCIAHYLANGFPVILELCDKSGDKPPIIHSTLIVGMHLSEDPGQASADSPEQELEQKNVSSWARNTVDLKSLPGRFVVLDIARHPFCELPASKLISQAWLKLEDESQQQINYLVVMAKGTVLGVKPLRRHFDQFFSIMTQEWKQFLLASGVSAPGRYKPSDATVNIRLLDLDEIVFRYLRTNDYVQFALQAEEVAIHHLEKTLKASGCSKWWCVEAGIPQGVPARPGQRLFLVTFWPGVKPPELSEDTYEPDQEDYHKPQPDYAVPSVKPAPVAWILNLDHERLWIQGQLDVTPMSYPVQL